MENVNIKQSKFSPLDPDSVLIITKHFEQCSNILKIKGSMKQTLSFSCQSISFKKKIIQEISYLET